MTQAPSVKPPPRSRCSCGSPTLTIVVSAACIAVATMTAIVANRRAERVAADGSGAIPLRSAAPFARVNLPIRSDSPGHCYNVLLIKCLLFRLYGLIGEMQRAALRGGLGGTADHAGHPRRRVGVSEQRGIPGAAR